MPKWEDSYSVENEMIDTQHKRLFEIAQAAYLMVNHPVTKEEIKGVLREFFEYMRDHFHDEEQYMESIGYPGLEEHKKLHRKIIFDLSEAIKTIRSANELKEKIGIIAKEWLLQHILKEDMQIRRYCKERIYIENRELANTFEYVCSCKNKVHRVNSEIHEKIQLHDAKFICKVCKQVIKYI